VFAVFGPGKFENVYTSLTNSAAQGRLHSAGEALSLRHGWVEGALDSAWRAVAELLTQPGFTSYQEKFFENWGVNAEWFTDEVLNSADGMDKVMKGNLLFRHLAV
jgi:hypothetical protein